MHLIWQRVPVIVRAVVIGAAIAAAGAAPWGLLVKANARYFPAVPWAVVPTALYLGIFWRYLQGAGWPRSTSEIRRTNFRANRLTAKVWGISLLAGGLGLAALVIVLRIMNRLVRLPVQPVDDLSHFPFPTVVSWVVMGSLVAGIVEESAFRGYMQSPIERRHGAVIAILVTGAFFGLAHFTHPEVSLILMPYYMAVAAIYGSLAYLTNSILPGVVLHAVGNILGAVDLLTRGHSEWQASPDTAPLIWQTGTDTTFWITCVAALLVGGAAVWTCTLLAPLSQDLHAADIAGQKK